LIALLLFLWLLGRFLFRISLLLNRDLLLLVGSTGNLWLISLCTATGSLDHINVKGELVLEALGKKTL